MIVRAALPADTECVMELIRATADLPQWSSGALATDNAAAENAVFRRLLIAEREGTLLGFVQTSLLLGEAELEGMAVKETCRRTGVGTRLMQKAMDLARRDGAEVFRLEVRARNVGAQRLYASAGLAVVGLRRAYYCDPVEDAVLMECRWPPELRADTAGPHPVL